MRIGDFPENAYRRVHRKYIQNDPDNVTQIRQVALTKESAAAVFLQDGINAVTAAAQGEKTVTVGMLLPTDVEEQDVHPRLEALYDLCKREMIPITDIRITTIPFLTEAAVQITARGTKRRQIPAAEGDVLMIGTVAAGGTGILAAEEKELLCKTLPESFVSNAAKMLSKISAVKEIEAAYRHGAQYCHSLGEGGVFAGLWKLASLFSSGIEADLKALPIRQETVEICEVFRLNPYLLLSTGSFLAVAKDAEELAEALMQDGINACPIGKLTAGNDRIIRNDGETRFLDLPGADEIYQVIYSTSKDGGENR